MTARAIPAAAGPAAGVGGGRQVPPLALLVATGTVVGAMLPLARLAHEAGVPPLALAFWQALGAGAALAAVAGPASLLRRPGGAVVRFGLVAGLLGIAVPNALVAAAVTRLGAGLPAVAYALPPLMTWLLSVALRMEPFDRRRGVGIAVAVLGCATILLPGNAAVPPGQGLWLGAILAIPASLALGNIYRSRAWPVGESPTTLGAATLLGAAAWLLPAMLLGGQGWIPRASGGVAVGIVAAQAGVTAFAYAVGLVLQRRAGPTYYSQLGFVVVLTGLAAGVVLFGERHGVAVWAGVLTLLVGAALARRRRDPAG